MGKNMYILIATVFGAVLLLSACGEKSQEDVVGKLEENLESMSGYKATAEMAMNTGEEEQTFMIDIWHKKKDFYRVQLTNDQDEQESQIILKNEEGVFVLTPALDKSFKFQSEWPENSSQPYLFQSLVNDIVADGEASFNATDSHYVFQTKTNYQSNNNLPYQEIRFNKKDFTPEAVKVLDKDKNAVIDVAFTSFDLDPSFEENDFALEDNMTSATAYAEDVEEEQSDSFSVLFPLETAGSELSEKKEKELDDGKRVIMTFEGEKHFTLIEEKRTAAPALSEPKEVEGDIVNLGHSIGVLGDNAIEWSADGIYFYLASEELTKEELIDVAQSVQGKEIK
ncbi:MAG TPA: outer membrane lipoprotein carrier protein LolA [Bacillota bacterium]|nr:outer membrane lipoprotein carrier protein LolA [Bacillota bacterium]